MENLIKAGRTTRRRTTFVALGNPFPGLKKLVGLFALFKQWPWEQLHTDYYTL